MATKQWNPWRGGGVAAMLIGALLLALLSAENSLPADDETKAVALPADLAKIPSDCLAVASNRIADLWSGELLKAMREKYGKEIDKIPKEFQAHIGLPLEQIERTTLVMFTPPAPRQEPLLFVRTVKPYDLAKVVAAIQNIKAKKYKDEMLYVGDMDWTIYPLDDRSLAYGGYREICALIDHPQPKKKGNLAETLRLAAGKHSAVVGVNIKRFMDNIGDRLPGEFDPFRPLLQALSATLTIDFTAPSRGEAAIVFATEEEAKTAIKPAQTGFVLLRAGLDRTLTTLDKEKETTDLSRLFKQIQEPLKAMRIERKGAALRASAEIKIDSSAATLALMEAVQNVREAAARAQSSNNLKQIALAMINYLNANGGRLPPHAIYDKNGKPLLSWRVLILPQLDQQNLYNQFHLSEPWDSEHNKKLLAKMPKVYTSPRDETAFKEHTTYYQGFVGKGAFFEGKKGLRFPTEFPDGLTKTMMIVEASKAVPWSKPEDIPYDPAKPLPKLGLPGAKNFLASICDGSVRTFTHKISKETLRNAIMRNDGNTLGPDF